MMGIGEAPAIREKRKYRNRLYNLSYLTPSNATRSAGRSFAYESGSYTHRKFRFSNNKLTNLKLGGDWGENEECREYVERVILMGYETVKVKAVKVEGDGRELGFVQENGILVIRKPELGVADDWTISIVS